MLKCKSRYVDLRGFRLEGLEFRVQASGSWVQGSGFRVGRSDGAKMGQASIVSLCFPQRAGVPRDPNTP